MVVEMLVSLLTSHLRRKIRCWFPVMGNTVRAAHTYPGILDKIASKSFH